MMKIHIMGGLLWQEEYGQKKKRGIGTITVRGFAAAFSWEVTVLTV